MVGNTAALTTATTATPETTLYIPLQFWLKYDQKSNFIKVNC